MILIKKKHLLLYLIVVSFVYACTDDGESEIIPPVVQEEPSEFEVKIESSLYTNPIISWSESFDPQNESIEYAVLLQDEILASNVSERTFQFQQLEQSKEYSGKVIATDESGNETASNFSFTTSANAAPLAFELVDTTTDNVSASIEWTEAVDPEQEEVLYSIFLDGQLVEDNYNSEVIEIQGLKAATEYMIKIVANDENGNTTDLEFTIATADGIYDDDLTLMSQASVDSFGAKGYVEITGYFTINGTGGGLGDITNLNALNTLTSVGKTFRILRNSELESLKGLENLKVVRGGIEIFQNQKLERIDELNNLETIGTYLWVKNNNAITTINGFNKLSVVETLFFEYNASLENVSGFENISVLARDLSISNNPLLNSINGLGSLVEMDRLFLEDTQLTNIDFLSTLKKTGSELRIRNNSSLLNINGLSELTEIQYGSLFIYSNTKLISLNGLENLNEIGGSVEITNNTDLNDFCALQNAMTDFVPSSAPRIYNNAFNPSVTDIANGICKP